MFKYVLDNAGYNVLIPLVVLIRLQLYLVIMNNSMVNYLILYNKFDIQISMLYLGGTFVSCNCKWHKIMGRGGLLALAKQFFFCKP